MQSQRTAQLLFILGLPLATLAAAVVVNASSDEAHAGTVVEPVVTAPVDRIEPHQFAFDAAADRSSVRAGSDGELMVEVTVTSEHTPTDSQRVPMDLVLVMDKSGSMANGKMRDARAAASEIVSLLGPEDRLSVVVFDDRARVVVPLTAATPGKRREFRQQIRGIEPGGGTNMLDGLSTGSAAHHARNGRARRTVLISDGLPNAAAGLRDLALDSARAETALTTVGIGADYDEALLTELADAGTGSFYWVTEGQDLAHVFADEVASSTETVASSATLIPTLPSGVELVDAAGLAIDGGLVRVGALYAGQTRSFFLRLRVDTSDVGEVDLGELSLQLVQPDQTRVALSVDLPAVDIVASERDFLASIDADQWGGAVVQEQWNRLRTEVSRAVQQGDETAAVAAIGAYRGKYTTMNATVQSGLVTDNLVELDALEADVEATLEQDHDARNNWAKTTNVGSYSGRRSGNYR
jgi:Ca-activated chloride channel family protein